MTQNRMRVLHIPFYFSVVVWGEGHTDIFTSFSLPSLLAESNFPALCAQHQASHEFNIYTTRESSTRISRSPAYKKLSEIMKINIYILEDLGVLEQPVPRVLLICNRHHISHMPESDGALVFLYPDVIWSNGSFSRLSQIAETGKRIVIVNGLGMSQEGVWPVLLQEFGERKEHLTVDSRKLVRLASQYPMSQTRTQFVDGEVFTSWPSRLFWRVGDEGFLVYNFHHYPLMMRPLSREILPRDGDDGEETIDGGDYPLRVSESEADYYVVRDSDEMFHCEVCPDSHLSSRPLSQGVRCASIAAWVHKYTNPMQRMLGLTPFRFHVGEPSLLWEQVEQTSNALMEQIIAWNEFFQKCPQALDEFNVNELRVDKLMSSIKQDSIHLYCHLGAELLKIKRLEEAEKYFQQALALSPTVLMAHMYLALISREHGDLLTAFKHATEVLRIDKSCGEGWCLVWDISHRMETNVQTRELAELMRNQASCIVQDLYHEDTIQRVSERMNPLTKR